MKSLSPQNFDELLQAAEDQAAREELGLKGYEYSTVMTTLSVLDLLRIIADLRQRVKQLEEK